MVYPPCENVRHCQVSSCCTQGNNSKLHDLHQNEFFFYFHEVKEWYLFDYFNHF